MRMILFFTLLFVFAFNTFSAPLIFKTEKELKELQLVELANIDTAKYKKVRVLFKIKDRPAFIYSKSSEILLNSAKKEFERVQDLVKQGTYSKSQSNVAEEALKKAERNHLYSQHPPFAVYAVEADESVLIEETAETEKSFIIDTPPARLSIKAFGIGTYKVFVYAE